MFTKSGKPLPEKTCCICKRVYGYYKRTNAHPDSRHPCEKCVDIYERKQKALEIKRERYRKKMLSKIGKAAIEHNEACEGDDLRSYTPMRYVSQEEIDRISKPLCPGHRTKVAFVMKLSGFYPTIDDQIHEAGYYRVDEGTQGGYFTRHYSGGLPTSRQNKTFQPCERSKRAKQENALIEHGYKQYAKRHVQLNGMDKSASTFFGVFAMAGAIANKGEMT